MLLLKVVGMLLKYELNELILIMIFRFINNDH